MDAGHTDLSLKNKNSSSSTENTTCAIFHQNICTSYDNTFNVSSVANNYDATKHHSKIPWSLQRLFKERDSHALMTNYPYYPTHLINNPEYLLLWSIPLPCFAV